MFEFTSFCHLAELKVVYLLMVLKLTLTSPTFQGVVSFLRQFKSTNKVVVVLDCLRSMHNSRRPAPTT